MFKSTGLDFNSMFINGLNQDLSLLVERTRMEWETMFTPDLVNLANQHTQTLEESPKRLLKFLIFNSGK